MTTIATGREPREPVTRDVLIELAGVERHAQELDGVDRVRRPGLDDLELRPGEEMRGVNRRRLPRCMARSIA